MRTRPTLSRTGRVYTHTILGTVQFFLAPLIVALAGRGLWKIIAVLAILGWPLTARLVRAEFLSLREREFVEAARALGMGELRVAIFTAVLAFTLFGDGLSDALNPGL